MIRYTCALVVFFFFGILAWGQNSSTSYSEAASSLSEQERVKAVIDRLFLGMTNKDSSLLAACFGPDARLNTTFIRKGDQKPQFVSETIENFTASIANLPPDIQVDEKLWGYTIEIDGPLATAWTPYSLFVNGQLQHCGTNAFQLHQDSLNQWKIHQITDTRTRRNCLEEAPTPKEEVDSLLTAWHLAAAKADLEGYFGLLSDQSYYMGTDPSEKWLKAEFYSFCKPYFDKGKAWDFTATQREVYLNDGHSLAWFEETLDTHMGPCRGSGVLRLTETGWKLDHYVLSLLLPNEDMPEYKSLFVEKK
ncbi:MAG: nuclear transport factor 2 family protein [Bacteroidota bacterium]